LKQVVDLVAPFIAELFSRSLHTGYFPDIFRQAFITPIVKKPKLDPPTPVHTVLYQTSVLSKLLERLVVRQLLDYLTSADLLPTLQSGFRSGHSTETAILRVLSDIILASRTKAHIFSRKYIITQRKVYLLIYSVFYHSVVCICDIQIEFKKLKKTHKHAV